MTDKYYDTKTAQERAGGIESHDIVRAKLTAEQYEGWNLGNVLSYLSRWNFKHEGDLQEQIRELEKCMVHLNWLKASVEERAQDPIAERLCQHYDKIGNSHYCSHCSQKLEANSMLPVEKSIEDHLRTCGTYRGLHEESPVAGPAGDVLDTDSVPADGEDGNALAQRQGAL